GVRGAPGAGEGPRSAGHQVVGRPEGSLGYGTGLTSPATGRADAPDGGAASAIGCAWGCGSGCTALGSPVASVSPPGVPFELVGRVASAVSIGVGSLNEKSRAIASPSSAVAIRPCPVRFATKQARSAARRISSAVRPSRGNVATPIETLTIIPAPAHRVPVSPRAWTAPRTRSATPSAEL